jgi:hypothetical protein
MDGGGARPWRAAYRRYRELEAQFASADAVRRPHRPLLRAAVNGPGPLHSGMEGYRAAQRLKGTTGFPDPPDAFISELRDFADLRASYDIGAPDFVFDDVYHLAFHQLPDWRPYGSVIRGADDCDHLYRGQRDDRWGVVAGIYRDLPHEPGRDAELRGRAALACSVAQAIASKRSIPFLNAIAIAQHYSDRRALGVATWLVDFSRDPWTSLFFASDSGVTGDTGIVWSIRPKEFNRLADGPLQPIGSLQLVVPSDVPRIDNQAGVFVAATHPEIFEQYVAFGWETRFRQHTGLRFEDPLLSICEDTIYPREDPVRAGLIGLHDTATTCRCRHDDTRCHVPHAVFSDPLAPQTYESLILQWLGTSIVGGTPDSKIEHLRSAASDLARFHARLQTRPYAGRMPDILSRSIHRLRATVNILCGMALDGQPVSLREAIWKAYIEQFPVSDPHAMLLWEALNDLVPRAPPDAAS